MGFHIVNPPSNGGQQAQVVADASKPVKAKRGPRTGSARPRPLMVSLDQPGRLRVGHMLSLLAVSSPTLYRRINSGQIPVPDGHDGRPYWNTKTIRAFLAGKGDTQ